jgi:hypothetical protein
MAPMALPSRVREILNAIRGVQTTLESTAVRLDQERSDMEQQFVTVATKKRKVVTFAKAAMTSSNYNFPMQFPVNGTGWSLTNFRANSTADLIISSPGSPPSTDRWEVTYDYDGTNVLTLTTVASADDESGLIKRATVGAVKWSQIQAAAAPQTTSATATSGSGRRRRGGGGGGGGRRRRDAAN